MSGPAMAKRLKALLPGVVPRGYSQLACLGLATWGPDPTSGTTVWHTLFSYASSCLVARLLQRCGQVVNENSCDVSRDSGNSGRAIPTSAGAVLQFQNKTRTV